jgi:hypothetical protein
MLFIISVSIKYASVFVFLGWGLWWVAKTTSRRLSWGGSQIIAHFLPLLTKRSQYFLPWYLLWPLTFLPMASEKRLKEMLLLFSVTGLLSYIPFIFLGEYTPALLSLRTIILFIPPISYIITQFVISKSGLEKKG